MAAPCPWTRKPFQLRWVSKNSVLEAWIPLGGNGDDNQTQCIILYSVTRHTPFLKRKNKYAKCKFLPDIQKNLKMSKTKILQKEIGPSMLRAWSSFGEGARWHGRAGVCVGSLGGGDNFGGVRDFGPENVIGANVPRALNRGAPETKQSKPHPPPSNKGPVPWFGPE